MEQENIITKYSIHDVGFEITLPNQSRGWMDDTWGGRGFANRCLPLITANGFGWSILNPIEFDVYWNGGSSYRDVVISFRETYNADHEQAINCNFADGILTFDFGFIIRTSKGHNLYVKGPANCQRDFIHPLEGIVETDWLPFPFTMNWRFTEPNRIVSFKKGDPICTFFPIPRKYLETWKTEEMKLEDNIELKDRYIEWSRARLEHNDAAMNDPNFVNNGQKHYAKGIYPNGDEVKDHQKTIRGCPFGGNYGR